MKKDRLINFIRNYSVFSIFTFFILLSIYGNDEKNVTTWQVPNQIVHELFNRPASPAINLVGKKDKIILRNINVYTPLEWLVQDVVRYGEIDLYEKSRAKTRYSFNQNLHISKIDFSSLDSTSINLIFESIDLPNNGKFGSEIFSNSQHSFLLNEYQLEKIVLWHVDTNTLETKILLDGGITQALGNEIIWFPNDESVLVYLIPSELEKPDKSFLIPIGPIIRETSGNESQPRTYPNLLENTYQEDLFEFYASSQLAILNTNNGEVKKILKTGIFNNCTISPDGRFLLVSEIIKPFSQKVPYFAFRKKWYVYDIEKDESIFLTNQEISDFRRGWVLDGKRYFMWHPLEQASLISLSALDGGDPDKKVAYRDELRILNYPFKGSGSSFLKIENRFSNILFVDKKVFIYDEYIWQTNEQKKYIVKNKSNIHLLRHTRRGQIYDQPGEIVTRKLPNGHHVAFEKNNNIYFIGDGLLATSRKPFVDIFNIGTFKKDRITEFDDPDFYISISGFYNNDPERLIITKQNRITPTNTFLIYLNNMKEIQLTSNKNNIPEITNLQKRVINYAREDGVELSGLLYLPEKYDGSERIPLLMNAYPREFTDSELASQSSHNDNQFSRPFGSRNLYMCFNGIAVLENASFPVVGDVEIVNNTYIEQTILNAKAAIDYLNKEGIIDPNKVVIQGHSYGAFMVANLLAHSDLFAGGIAQNGAYNRTLTPFGFQSERRTLWEARDVYVNMSPFFFVDKISKPLLLIHSSEDQNSGTFPIQSRRLFEALEGNGKNSRFIQLPLEGHHYRAKETHLHLLWEYQTFFEKYIK